MLINVYGNKENVAASYANDAGEQTSATFVWIILVDYGNVTIRTVGIHMIVTLRMDKYFEKLIVSLDNTENVLSNMINKKDRLQYYSKFQNFSFGGIAFIIVVVWY